MRIRVGHPDREERGGHRGVVGHRAAHGTHTELEGVLSGKVSSADAAKSYTVSVTVKDSSTPTKQTATSKLSLVVAS